MSAKFDRFRSALKKLCNEHDVVITVSDGAEIMVLDAVNFEQGEVDYFLSLIDDMTDQ